MPIRLGVITFILAFSCQSFAFSTKKPFKEDVTSENFSRAFEYVVDGSVTPDLKKQLMEDLVWLLNVKGRQATSSHEKIFGGGVSGKKYLNWIFKQVVSIEFKLNEDVIAYVSGNYYFSTSPLFLGKLYLIIANREERIATLIHEIRHLSGVSHVSCALDSEKDLLPLTMERDCDKDESGAYAVEGIFSRNMALNCESCTTEERNHFRQIAIESLSRVNQQEARLSLQNELFHKGDADLFFSSIKRNNIESVRHYLDERWVQSNVENEEGAPAIVVTPLFSPISDLLLERGADYFVNGSGQYNIFSSLVFDICFTGQVDEKRLALVNEAVQRGLTHDVYLMHNKQTKVLDFATALGCDLFLKRVLKPQ